MTESEQTDMADLNRLSEIINKVFEILELIVVRVAILGLTILGAYTLFKRHP